MPERILVVDDNRDAADALARCIEAFGCEARAVYSGEEAIRETGRFEPDMVFLDINMPGLDGYETASRLRQQRDHVHLIVVAVTGLASDGDKHQAYASGFDLHVTKPMSPQKLRELIALLDPSADAQAD
jgi:CheY-like chemotaxis protein